MLKTCSKCKEEKDIESFYRNSQCGTKDGRNSWCKECHHRAKREYYHNVLMKDPDRVRQYRNTWNRNNRVRARELKKNSYEKLKKDAIRFYSNGTMKCFCCGEDIYLFLSIDHIDGGGNKHRKVIGRGGLYQWLRNNHYPTGFQVLCYNCNFAKGHYGKCPHKEI